MQYLQKCTDIGPAPICREQLWVGPFWVSNIQGQVIPEIFFAKFKINFSEINLFTNNAKVTHFWAIHHIWWKSFNSLSIDTHFMQIRSSLVNRTRADNRLEKGRHKFGPPHKNYQNKNKRNHWTPIMIWKVTQKTKIKLGASFSAVGLRFAVLLPGCCWKLTRYLYKYS